MYFRLAWILALVGCGPVRVGGSIDGEGVGGAKDAIWDKLSLAFGPFAYELTVVVVTDFPDACGTYGHFLEVGREAFGCDDVCESYVALADERGLHREAYWSTVLSINTSEGQTGTFDHDAGLQEGEFDAAFNDYDAAPLRDLGACEDACEDGDLLVPEVEGAKGGQLELEADGDLLVGRFEVSFGGEDGLDGRFVAEPCDMTEWVWPF